MQFYKTARELRKNIVRMLRRIFDREKDLYKTDPAFILSLERGIYNLLRSLFININMANSIYPVIIEEVTERQIYQDKAIGCCEALYQELEFLVDIFPSKVKEVSVYVKDIEYEINLLRKWKKSNNKIRNRLKENKGTI